MIVSNVTELLIIGLIYLLCLQQRHMACHDRVSEQRKLLLDQAVQRVNILILLAIDSLVCYYLKRKLIFLLENE